MNPAGHETRHGEARSLLAKGATAGPASSAVRITPPDELRDTRKYADAPSASYEELRGIGSWTEVKAMYAAKGHDVNSDDKCLELVKSDWRLIRSALWQKAITSPLPAEFPHESVVVDGKKIDVIGVWHTLAAHADTKVLLDRKLLKYRLLLAEENLGCMNFGMHSHGLDIPDHFARGVLHAVAEAEKSQLRAVKNWISRKLFSLRVKTKVSAVVDDDFLKPKDPAAQRIAQVQEQLGLRDDTIAALSRMSLVLPGDSSCELPANIELAYKHEKRLPYTMCQARSAFMAEFLRRWDVERTLKQCDHQLNDADKAAIIAGKSIICGQAHQPEVIFFLAHGTKEDRVTARAQRAADVLSEQGAAGLRDLHLRNQRLFWAYEAPISMAKGIGLGGGLISALRLFP